jgi:hypothetical protein
MLDKNLIKKFHFDKVNTVILPISNSDERFPELESRVIPRELLIHRYFFISKGQAGEKIN